MNLPVSRRSGPREGKGCAFVAGNAAHAVLLMLLPLMLAVPATAGGRKGSVQSAPGTPAMLRVLSRDPSLPAKQFRVVLACTTPASRAKGLQGFRRLQPGEAALFEFDDPTDATFWMGSVPYPIDIVFVEASGTVVRVFADCRPGSRELFRSGMPILRAIETAAGAGIREGDRVSVVIRDAAGSR